MSPLAGLRARLAALSPRERAGLSMIGAVACLTLAVQTFDWSTSAASRELLARDTARETAGAFQHASDARYQEAIGLAANKAWRGAVVDSTVGVAQARLAALVQDLAAVSGFSDADVRADQAPVQHGQVTVLSVTLHATFDWQNFNALLNEFANADTSLTVQSLSVTSDLQGPRSFTMVLTAPYLSDAAQP